MPITKDTDPIAPGTLEDYLKYLESNSPLDYRKWLGQQNPQSPVNPEPVVQAAPLYDNTSFLQTIPKGVFESGISGLSGTQQRFFRPRFGDIYGEFEGEVARQAQAGKKPTLQFGDFIKGIDFNQRFFSTPRYQRGFDPGRTIGRRTRFLPNF